MARNCAERHEKVSGSLNELALLRRNRALILVAGRIETRSIGGIVLLGNKVAIITGAASARGIGKAMAGVFAEQGARVAILDLNAEAAADAARDIGSDHLGLACDVT